MRPSLTTRWSPSPQLLILLTAPPLPLFLLLSLSPSCFDLFFFLSLSNLFLHYLRLLSNSTLLPNIILLFYSSFFPVLSPFPRLHLSIQPLSTFSFCFIYTFQLLIFHIRLILHTKGQSISRTVPSKASCVNQESNM